MMKVVELNNTYEVDPETVSALETLLEEAKSGKLRSIIYVTSDHTGEPSYGGDGETTMRMIGALEQLKLHVLLQRLKGDELL